MLTDFKAEHLAGFVAQDAQAGLQQYINSGFYAKLEGQPGTYTLVDKSGETLAIGGIIKVWPGRWQLWSVVSRGLKRGKMIKLHRAALKMMAIPEDGDRIEAVVDVGFEAGMKWMKLLGLQPEGYLRRYSPLGNDVVMFAAIKGGKQ